MKESCCIEDRPDLPPHEGEKGVNGVAEEIYDGHVLWQHDRKGVPVRVISGASVVLCNEEGTHTSRFCASRTDRSRKGGLDQRLLSRIVTGILGEFTG